MKLRELTAYSIVAISLAVVGTGLGVWALLSLNPFLALFALTLVCSGGVSALVGLQDR